MANNLTVKNLYVKSGGAIYIYPVDGDSTTDGCKKIISEGNDLVIYLRVLGEWVEIWRYSA